MKKNKKGKRALILLIVILLLLITIGGAYIVIKRLKPSIKSIEITNYDYDKNEVNISVEISSLNKNIKCFISDEKLNDLDKSDSKAAVDNTCSFTKVFKNYYIYLKNKDTDEIFEFQLSDYYKKTYDLKVNTNKMYLAVGESSIINTEVLSLNEDNKELNWSIDGDKIVNVDNGKITALEEGKTSIIISTPDGYKRLVEVIVTNLITIPQINNERAFLTCKQYNEEEAKILDDILKTKIANVGYQTRAGVVEAARFLTLRFPYRVNYFIETGRLNNYGTIDYVDGEGRYYHKGLYLSEDKYKSLAASQNGPAMWGCNLAQDNGLIRQNGFDCSGFVTWVLYNGGFNVKDTGAGWTDRTDEVADLGEFHYVSLEFLRSGNVKAGDLIGSNGHAAIIAGMDENHVYIAESLVHNIGVTMLTYTYEELAASSKFTYIALMGNVYKDDGNYTSVWY